MVCVACGATLNDASVGISARPFERRGNRVDLGVQVVGFFPAPSAAFDRHRSGALEDVTGASLGGGEPPFVGTP
jgi:hypothetical protein